MSKSVKVQHLPAALAISITVMLSLIVFMILIYVFGQLESSTEQAIPGAKTAASKINPYLGVTISLIAVSLALGLLLLYYTYTTIRGE